MRKPAATGEVSLCLVYSYASRLMIDATYPAPNPLSMFTTDTFDAQELSIPKQRAQAVERRAVADAGRHGNHRHADQSSDNAGQRAFHSGTNNYHPRTR